MIDITFVKPDKLVMKWGFQHNWKDILKALKSMGNARFNKTDKSWSIPVTAAPTIAEAIRPHYAELADAIMEVGEVTSLISSSLKRVELSDAVDTDNDLLKAELNALITGEPYPHQYVAADIYRTGERNRILIADEMGLGKSLSALLCVTSANHKRTLIVCPASVKSNWEREIVKWLPQASTAVLQGNTVKDNEMVGNEHFVIINYTVLSKRLEMLQQCNFDCIIFDECHALKNVKSQRTIASKSLCNWPTINGLVFLSGTPVLNRPRELFNTLNMLLPAKFNNWWAYAKAYCGAYQGEWGWVTDGASNIEKSEDGYTPPLAGLIKDIMIRRTMDDPRIADSMPSLVQTIHTVDLTDEERNQYDNELNQWMSSWDDYRDMGSGAMPPGWALNMLTNLRHAVGRLKTRAAKDWALEYNNQTGKPLVIFAHHKDVLEDVANLLGGVKIDGSTSLSARQEAIDEFQAGNIDYLVCSTLAMKEGVNLERADTTLFIEREWVPAYEKQAAARVRRLTQESSVCHQVILSASDTIDEHFDKVLQDKATLVGKVMDDNGDSDVSNSIVNDLMKQLEVMRTWQ